jgi:hypothetical protein
MYIADYLSTLYDYKYNYMVFIQKSTALKVSNVVINAKTTCPGPPELRGPEPAYTRLSLFLAYPRRVLGLSSFLLMKV